MKEVDVVDIGLDRLEPIIGSDRYGRFRGDVDPLIGALGSRKVWHVNSTATGGGVAEMLQNLLGYARDGGAPQRWVVLEGNPEFFAVTKRIHNNLHGVPGDSGPLGDAERRVYDDVTRPNADELLRRISPDDVVVLHDPQTAGLIGPVRSTGATTVWRCHVGRDDWNDHLERAWGFLRPYLGDAHSFVFTRSAYAPEWLDRSKVAVIPPSIDPFSAKNQHMDDATVAAILGAAGLAELPPGAVGADPTFLRGDGRTGRVERQAAVLREGGPPPLARRTVVQVSRWDRLKDMTGVLQGFVRSVTSDPALDDVDLALVGPSVAGVTDDPEGQEVLEECRELWQQLPEVTRHRVSLVSLPMDDVEENAAMVNAIQRHASVLVQKSLVEGFGLTVTEAMWKGRPTVASGVGGIKDQIVDGESGLLVHDPSDLDEFGECLRRVLADDALAVRLGQGAHERVSSQFLADRHLRQWAELLTRLS